MVHSMDLDQLIKDYDNAELERRVLAYALAQDLVDGTRPDPWAVDRYAKAWAKVKDLARALRKAQARQANAPCANAP